MARDIWYFTKILQNRGNIQAIKNIFIFDPRDKHALKILGETTSSILLIISDAEKRARTANSSSPCGLLHSSRVQAQQSGPRITPPDDTVVYTQPSFAPF